MAFCHLLIYVNCNVILLSIKFFNLILIDDRFFFFFCNNKQNVEMKFHDVKKNHD